MKRFLVKALAFLVLQASVFALFWNPVFPREQNYLAATIDKHERLRSARSPRIILAGGSNLAFGIKSEPLEHALGRPLVNMGLNAALGIPFMLNEVEQEVRPGDIVVLSFEYDIFSGVGVELVLRQILELRPASFRYITQAKWKRLMDAYGLSILGGVARRTLFGRYQTGPPLMSEFSTYSRTFFDKQGSYGGHYGQASKNPELHPIKFLGISAENRQRILEFARYCHSRGASCVFTCPPHPRPLLDPVPATIQHNLQVLTETGELKVLDSPAAMRFPTNAFFDTCYHLVEEAATERTRRLIEELRPLCPGK